MMLHFSKRFVSSVLDGSKCMTFRKMRKRPFRRGDVLTMYQGPQNKPVLFARSEVGRVWSATLLDELSFSCDIDLDVDEMAKQDGFESYAEMVRWIEANYAKLPIEGQLIVWKKISPP